MIWHFRARSQWQEMPQEFDTGRRFTTASDSGGASAAPVRKLSGRMLRMATPRSSADGLTVRE
ncbi:hypothetical protein [Kitasatospora sp. CB01950]|uniref:hypothetical protein n=1 Tax=Kitasatospora sp. CB01950 TaxID=1703930 RepID=UPI0011612D47